MAKLEKSIEEIYTKPSSPGSFGGVEQLFRECRRRKIKVTKSQVEKWLTHRLTYTLHKPARKTFKRNKTTVFYIDELWQMDLCDMRELKEFNDDATFLLTVIDVFSKHGFARPLLNKKGETVTEAFLDILAKSGRKPYKVQTDAGTEFKNKKFNAEIKKRDIIFYVTFSENKAAVVERFNRTLKSKMWRYFTHANTFRYLDVLDDLISSYNSTPHSTLKGMRPIDVSEKNQLNVWNDSYSSKLKKKRFKYGIGDQVRISRDKGPFGKGYKQNWSEEYFEIFDRIPRHPPVYRIQDLNGEKLEGVFYTQQLQRVPAGQVFPISKIIRKQKNKVLVRWRGWPDSFNSWVAISDLEKI